MVHQLRLLCLGFLVATVACSGGSLGRPVHTATDIDGGTGMRLTSSAFDHEGQIPSAYTCDGRDVSPPLTISGVPPDAVSLVLVMDDPDAPGGTWDHWIEFNIPVTTSIPEDVGSLGIPGKNSWDNTGYGGPCPPGGTHRYFFSVYALDTNLGLGPDADKAEILDALSDHVLAEATLMGRYSR